jgi:predicted nuclease of predicted toxin-antitoxin system
MQTCPAGFHFWAGNDYVFDFGATWTDAHLWDYARSENLVVVTKDSDFRILALVQESPPKVVHIRFGNMKMRQFFTVMTECWREAAALLSRYRLIEVWPDRVVALS